VCPLRLLHTNKLTGTIPDSFGNLSNLLELYVMFQPCGDSLNHSLTHSLTRSLTDVRTIATSIGTKSRARFPPRSETSPRSSGCTCS